MRVPVSTIIPCPLKQTESKPPERHFPRHFSAGVAKLNAHGNNSKADAMLVDWVSKLLTEHAKVFQVRVDILMASQRLLDGSAIRL